MYVVPYVSLAEEKFRYFSALVADVRRAAGEGVVSTAVVSLCGPADSKKQKTHGHWMKMVQRGTDVLLICTNEKASMVVNKLMEMVRYTVYAVLCIPYHIHTYMYCRVNKLVKMVRYGIRCAVHCISHEYIIVNKLMEMVRYGIRCAVHCISHAYIIVNKLMEMVRYGIFV
jgi:hypothetical protein